MEPITPPAINAVNFDIDPILAIADIAQAQTIDVPTLTAYPPNWVLTIGDVTQAQVFESPTLIAHVPTWALTVADIAHAQTVDNITITAHEPQQGEQPIQVRGWMVYDELTPILADDEDVLIMYALYALA